MEEAANNATYSEAEIKGDILRMYSSPIYQKLNEYYRKEDIFSIINKSRDENTHSDFLAWLFDSHSGHGLGIYPAQMLLRVVEFALSKPLNSTAYLPDNFVKFINNDSNITSVSVNREQILPSEVRGKKRLDLVFDINFLPDTELPTLKIIIENKVKSDEHDEQTVAYFDLTQSSKQDDEEYIYIYLSAKSNEYLDSASNQDCASPNFIQINYQQLLDYVIEPCQNRDLPNEVKVFIDNYVRCLGDTKFFEEENFKGVGVMAVTGKENELLRKFWDDNEKLIKAAINTVLSDANEYDNVSDEDQDILESALQINEKSKGKKYKYNGKKTPLNQIVLKFVKYFVEQHPNIGYDELSEIFYKKIQGSSGVIKKVKDLNETDKGKNRGANFFLEDSILLADGVEIVVCTQWGAGGTNPNFFNFKKKMEELGYGDMIQEI